MKKTSTSYLNITYTRLLVTFFFKSMVNMGNKVTVLQSVSVPRNILDEKNFNILSKYNLYTFARHIFFQIYGEHGQQSHCSTIGFRTPEYLGCLKLEVVPGLRVRERV